MPTPPGGTHLLISCLIPTRDRPKLIPLAIACFLRQTHTDRELLILDDGNEPVRDLIPPDPRITYTYLDPPPRSIGKKLNMLARAARGTICCNWDDDDWSSNDRLEHQLDQLLKSKLSVTGYNSILYWDMTDNTPHAWKYPRPQPYACGSSQLYFRAWLLRHPLPNKNIGVDRVFSDEAVRYRALNTGPGEQHLVARFHQQSLWMRRPAHCPMPFTSIENMPQQFLADIGWTKSSPKELDTTPWPESCSPE